MSNEKKNLIVTEIPRSHITQNKKRLKQNVDTVYLKNGDEFEIELFNPTENKILARIELNGDYIGNDIVLRPGERVFLERYLNEPKKFTYKTYEVESDDPIIQNAIRNNGNVIVKFYEEWLPTTIWNHYWTTTNYPQYWTNTSQGYIFNTGTSVSSTNTSNITFTNTSSNIVQGNMETGRVEKGEYSNQTFSYDNSNFKLHYEWSNWWKILPKSLKHITSEDLKIFCTNCGAKRKKDNHKFCPHCGTQYK